MTRWLSDDEQQVWRTYLDVVARQMEALDHDLQERSDLALTDYEILVMLAEAPNQQVRMSELANLVIVSRSRLTYRVDRLAERGLVKRVDFVDDRRGVLAAITDAGIELLAEAAPGHVDLVRRLIFDHIEPNELEMFSAVVARMAASDGL